MVAWVSVSIEALNVAFLSALLYVYARNHAKMKTKFTLSLLSFASLFLLERFLAIYFYTTLDMCSAIEIAEHIRPILSSIEMIGLVILLLITLE
ncbi:MAG: hypothetical protein ACUVUS_07880 [Thermoproteota archaeon]